MKSEKMIKFIKRKTIALLMIIMLLFPKCSFSQPVDILTGQEGLEILSTESSFDILELKKDLNINVSLHKDKERYRFKIDSACIDLFDYSIIKGHLLSLEEEFKVRLSIEKKICEDTLDLLEEKFNERTEFYKLEISTLNRQIIDLNDTISNNKKSHEQELKIWKWTTVSVSVVSLIFLYGLIK